MSWIQKLYETYNNCQENIGYADQQDQRPLLPICHITTQAHIEIVINGEGIFRRARVITDKANSTTIIPSTERSAGRAGSRPESHPLCDKLQYLAGDFIDYGGIVTSGFSKDPQEPFRNYIGSLTDWSNSLFTHPKVNSVLKYVIKKTVIKDLIEFQILYIGSDRQFLNKEDVERDRNAKDIFSVVPKQQNAFIRWVIESPNDNESRAWRDKTLWKCWIDYYLSDK
ncbi:MAG: type I-C CRISPR-associated protein Cas8c/Csd1, partial [Anaerolineaceae bacterium]|nr:type I-C CRISPR-associated protein Cas8c/Csd1 [Anaerolineaceae bacterium]